MIDQKLLELIQCPIDGQPLAEADSATLAVFNEWIARRELRDASDGLIEEPMEGALTTMDGRRGYAIRGGIPTLIPGESFTVPDSQVS